ncbi:MAG TPA: ElyC/SanA/YdcF family protein [Streptosporangiaceae bacterium]
MTQQLLRGAGPVLRRWAGPGSVAVSLAGFAVMAPTGWTYASTGRYRVSADEVPATPVALVLGAGARDNQPTPLLARRLDLAADLYRRGKVKVLLVSGDNSTKDYDEPTVMRDYLVAHGIPDRRIVRDYAGFDTWNSCIRAKRIFGVDRAIVVTQNFHLPRAITLCRAAGVAAYGVGDDSFAARPWPTLKAYVREPLATIKATYTVARRPDPHFLGPVEMGVQRALADT